MKTTKEKALVPFSSKVISIIVSLALAVSMTPSFGTTSAFAVDAGGAELQSGAYSGGTGTAEDPYQITTPQDMQDLSDAVDGGETYSGVYFKMTNDISLSSVIHTTWTPIGNKTTAFAGFFDGNGYEITDLTINVMTDDYQALFGNVSGTVQKLTVIGQIVTTTTGDCVAGIVAKLSAGGTITQCKARCMIDANAAYNVGGVVGMVGEKGQLVSDSNKMATVSQCVFAGSVYGKKPVGGIAGHNAGTIEGCVNTGSVKGNNGASKGGDGGICGYNGINNTATDAGIVKNCYNLGYVNSQESKWSGGLVGFQNSLSTTSNSYNAGKINFTNERTYPLIGQSEGTTKDCLWLNEDTGDTTENYVASDGLGVGDDGSTASSTNCVAKSRSELQSLASATFLNTVSETSQVGDVWTTSRDDEGFEQFPMLLWQKENYKVTFNTNGGSEVEAQWLKVGEDKKAIRPDDDPTKEGCTFDGWYADEALTQKFDFTQVITLDTTVYAKWTTSKCTVTFNTNGGSDVATQIVNYGQKVTKPVADPTKTGYKFDGWYADKDFKNAFNFDTAIKANATIYAKWTAISSATSDSDGNVLILDPTTSKVLRIKLVDADASAISSCVVSIDSNGAITIQLSAAALSAASAKKSVTVTIAYEDGTVLKDKAVTVKNADGTTLGSGKTDDKGQFTIVLADLTRIKMYRLYNQWTGEHFYTADADEQKGLVKVGWTDEGTGWYAPTQTSISVYRLYNPYVEGGDHHYTMSAEEKDECVKAGWSYEGIAWYSCEETDTDSKPLYRQYNPNEQTGTHNYTMSEDEAKMVVAAGWRDEGTAWRGYESE